MKFLIIFSALLSGIQSYAAASLSTKIHNPYGSIRALGMGNAFTAVADDYSLIMYNPAGFARKKNNEIQISLLGAGVAPKTLTFAKDVTTASQTQGTDVQKSQAISDVLEKYYGEALGGKVQALELFWVRNGWGVALLPLDLTVDLSINRQLGPAIDLNIKGDTTIAYGLGKEINKYIDAGVTLKYLHRVSVSQTVSAFELATDSNILSTQRFNEGTAFDLDLGFMWRPNWFNTRTTVVTPEKSEMQPALVIESPAVVSEKNTVVVSADATQVKTEEIKNTDPAADKKIEEKRTPQAESIAASADDTKAADSKMTPLVLDKKDEAALATKEEVKEEAKIEPVVIPAQTEQTAVSASDEKFPLTFGFVVRNAIGSSFTLSKSVNKAATVAPAKNERVIDLGTQYLLRDGEDFKIRTMVDFKNILHPEITLNKSFHAGVELDYSPSTWFKTQFRTGINQMYFTGGATFLFGLINIDLATYGEEVGTSSEKKENRVLAAKLGFNL